jgi:hypothetical protein
MFKIEVLFASFDVRGDSVNGLTIKHINFEEVVRFAKGLKLANIVVEQPETLSIARINPAQRYIEQ